jgi:hypothetical protein
MAGQIVRGDREKGDRDERCGETSDDADSSDFDQVR